MRPSVRDAFVRFTAPLEGVVPWMYADVKGLVTTAIGNLIDPINSALALPWQHIDGTPATRDEIIVDWMRVKSDPSAAKNGYRYTQLITRLRLDDDGVRQAVYGKLDNFDQYLASRFPHWEEWPADAQLATLSMSWACGPAFRFPALDQTLRDGDFSGAARSCHINEAGNPGLIPRNRVNKVLYLNAAKVVRDGLDPDVLVWPASLHDDTPTEPRLQNPASVPTIYPSPIVHVDPSEYLGNGEPDDST